MSFDIPEGWEIVNLENFTKIIMGQSPPSSTYNEDGKGLPFYQGKAEFGTIYPTPKKWCDEPQKIAEKGDILISVRAPVGPSNICNETSCIGRGLAAIKGLEKIDPLFIFYLLQNFKSSIASQGTGTTFSAISGEKIKAFPVPLPPLNEQKRIVTKIEALQQRSDRAKTELEAIKPLLSQFRQSVLSTAFRGDLTRDWREKNPDIEPAEVLLERIKIERRRKWEETELEKMKARGNTPKDDKWKEKYKEPESVNIEGLSELPDGWCWVTTELACSDIIDCPHSTATYTEQGKIIIRTSNFKIGKLDLSETKFVSEETFKKRNQRLKPKEGDILYSREGGIFGIACPVSDMEICMGQRMMLLRTDPHLYNQILLMWLMNSSQVFAQAQSKVIGSASPHVNRPLAKVFLWYN